MNKPKSYICGFAICTSLIGCVQEKSQTNVHTILTGESPICTEKTHLYHPQNYPKLDLLKEFKTCTSPLTITVLPNGELEIKDASNTWIGILTPNGSIRVAI